MLKIWGRDNSVNVIKVLWCARELGLEYERIDAGGAFGRTRTEDFLAMNPMGLVPVIDDGGFVLWESNACVRYLCARHGAGSLYPEDLRERALAEQWMDWQLSALGAPMTTLFWNLVRKSAAERDAVATEQAAARSVELFGMLDRRLQAVPQVAGRRFTMGDIPIGALAFRFFTLVQDRPPMPGLEAWYRRLTERPAYRECAMRPLS